MRPAAPLARVLVQLLVLSRFHFPASLRSTVVTRFAATTDALTSSGRLFGLLPGRNTVPAPGGEVHCLSRQRFLPFCLPSSDVHVRAFSLSSPFSPPVTLAFRLSLATASRRSLGFGSRFRVCLARSPVTPDRIEFTFRGLTAPGYYGLAVRFQLLSTDGLRRRSFFPLQAG